jgi:AraC-like DNA-binding protein
MLIEGRGRISVWEGASLWVLEAARTVGQTDFHAHHAIQVTLSLEGDFELRTANERRGGPAVAVASGVPHIFQATGIAAFLFVEPESRPGRAMAAAIFRECALGDLPGEVLAGPMAALAACFRADGSEAELVRHGQDIVAALSGALDPPAADPRVLAMLAYAESGIGARLSLAGAADAACLSPSRARHLFAEQAGLPFRTFVLWVRIRKAVALYAAGASLTEAAHEAGFADSAHLSRTFRRTFGLPAAALRLNGGFTGKDAEPRIAS